MATSNGLTCTCAVRQKVSPPAPSLINIGLLGRAVRCYTLDEVEGFNVSVPCASGWQPLA